MGARLGAHQRLFTFGQALVVWQGCAGGGWRSRWRIATTKSESWKDGRNLDTKINLRCKLFRTLEVDI